ncbi:cobaltochelatase CobT-related protein [Qipengyuania profunda]|uniref:cobaltochelatase CobT-related protein n=1 Tax=Qipengyuania profunda TaxID=3113984 RepID=UPI002A189A00|nr:hypothetical protein [Qipengyuania sp. HL-TH1]WPL55972.1 hypothetical protein SD421_10865 [Qipengyuania sp. HL-TH5]
MLNGALTGIFWGAVILFLWWLGRRAQARPVSAVADWPEQVYSSYTEEFDLEIRARDLPALLDADGTAGESPSGDFERDIDRRREAYLAARAHGISRLVEFRPPKPPASVCLLIDLSGSMAKRLPEVLGEVRAISEWLTKHESNVAVYGFTTRGWRGGPVRKNWLADGSPEYPGRLCALVHIVVSDFGSPGGDDDWDALLRTDILRENVDGEALRWAADRLVQERTPNKMLVVLSDGAPVDDATLAANGNSFLFKDMVEAMSEIEKREHITPIGIGLDYRVSEFYPQSGLVEEGGSLLQAIIPFLDGTATGGTRTEG